MSNNWPFEIHRPLVNMCDHGTEVTSHEHCVRHAENLRDTTVDTPGYRKVVVATEIGLAERTGDAVFVEYIRQNVIRTSHRHVSVQPYYEMLMGMMLHEEYDSRGVVLVVRDRAASEMVGKYRKISVVRVDSPAREIYECRAFMAIGAPFRGMECGRGSTRIFPENSAAVMRAFRDDPSRWHVYSLPENSKKCILVVHTSHVNRELTLGPNGAIEMTGYFFNKNDGGLIASSPCYVRSVVGTCVFEVCLDPANDSVIVYDGCVVDGASIRKLAHEQRTQCVRAFIEKRAPFFNMAKPTLDREVSLLAKVRVLQPQRFRIEREEDVDILAETAGCVIAINNTAPCEFYSGGGIFMWKPPTMLCGEAVLMCSMGRAMAVSNGGTCVMDPVGRCECKLYKRDPNESYAHLCKYVSNGVWKCIRTARTYERLCTVAEAAIVSGNGTSDMFCVSRITLRNILAHLLRPESQPQFARPLPKKNINWNVK